MAAEILNSSDPEWLPSTIVQSSAALVAIIGGLLIARLVGMASERGELAEKLTELDEQLASAQSHHRDLTARRAGWDLGDFIDSASALYYDEGIRSADGLADRIAHGANRSERLKFAEIFLAWVGGHESRVRDLYSGEAKARSIDDLRAAGFEIEPIFEPVAERLLRKLTPRESGPFGFGFDGIISPFTTDAAGRTVTLQRWDTLLRDIENTELRIREVSKARDLVSARLDAVTPHGVTGTLLALGGVVLAGIAFPIALMALRWPDLSPPWRWALVGAFLLSVAGVGIYIQRFARSLVSR